MLEKINHKSAPKEVVNALVTLYHEGKYDDVLSRSSQLIKEYPHTFVLHNIVGAISFEKGQKKVAIEHFRKVIELRPHHPHAYNNLGATLIDISEYQEAKSNLKKAIELQPDYEEAYNNLGNAYKAMEEYNKAIQVYEKAIELNPQYYEAYNNLGAALGKNAQYDEAIEAYNKTISLKPDFAEAYNNMGIALKEQGKLEEAIEIYNKTLSLKPDYAEAFYNIGVAFQEQGNLNEAIEAYNKALLLNPDNAEAYNNMGIALKEQGRLEEAIETYKKALSLKPDYAEAFYNMGIAFKDQSKLNEAIEVFKKALLLNPDNAEAHNNMGIAMQDQGKLDKALEAYKKAIAIKPDYAEAYINIGIALKDQGKLDESIEAYIKALSLKPDKAEAFYNMGITLQYQGKLDEAIKAYNKALSLKPDYAEAYYNMGISLRGTIFKKPIKGLQNTISSLLDKKIYVRPADIAVTAISLLKFEPSLNKQLKRVRSVEVIQNPLDIISELDELTLLRKLMSICPLPDLELEKLFKNLRASILENISSLKESSPELLRFQSALALQCFTNEYIYSQSQNEEKAINVLEKKIKKILSNNEQPSPLEILILASYKALHKYDWCQSLVVTNQIQEVFTRQVEEPNQEEKLKLNFPILEEISNKVSSKVRQQYEERPYPRWVNLGLNLESAPIKKVTDELQLKLNNGKINEVKNPNILIAGCGTGQHAITTAAMFKSSKVLAIDLSLSSLAYAKRKTEEFGIKNVEYIQADILDLGKLNKQFDIIESGGVLHHMDNPLKGWKLLTDCLKPGGLMRLGLYSELARQNIVKIRKAISQTGIGSSDTEMRSFRDMMIKSDKKYYNKIFKFSDFYSLSTLKDLLFHVQEHRFTIPLIKDYLNELGITFCGFESNKIVSHFKLTNKDKKDPYDLDKWKVYEEANPIAFTAMYQFWCQKDLITIPTL